MGGFAVCRGTLGCHTSGAIPVLRPHLCILLLHSSPSPWAWLQLGCSSGREAIPEMAAWQHQELLPAGLCGGSARAAPGDRHCTPGLEGQRGAGTVCCVVQSHPALGINRVRDNTSCDSRAGCSMHSQEVTWCAKPSPWGQKFSPGGGCREGLCPLRITQFLLVVSDGGINSIPFLLEFSPVICQQIFCTRK